MDSQGSSRHQCFYVVSVYVQGLVVLIHGFHVPAVFKMIHPQTHAEGSKETKKKEIEYTRYSCMDLTFIMY